MKINYLKLVFKPEAALEDVEFVLGQDGVTSLGDNEAYFLIGNDKGGLKGYSRNMVAVFDLMLTPELGTETKADEPKLVLPNEGEVMNIEAARNKRKR